MKNRLLFGLLGCIAIGGVTSCHEQKEVVEKPTPIQLEVEEKLAGKWEVATVDEIPVLTNEKSVVTYEDGWKSYRSLSDKRMTAGWLVNSTFKCSIYGNQITETSKDNGGDSIKFVTKVGEISYSEINATIRRSYNHGSEDSHRYVLRKIKDDLVPVRYRSEFTMGDSKKGFIRLLEQGSFADVDKMTYSDGRLTKPQKEGFAIICQDKYGCLIEDKTKVIVLN